MMGLDVAIVARLTAGCFPRRNSSTSQAFTLEQWRSMMAESILDSERSPKGDHNRRLALGIDIDVFAENAGVSTEQLHDYETTGPDGKFDLAVAHKVGVLLGRYEAGEDVQAPKVVDEPASETPAAVREAGPQGMRDAPAAWEKIDEAVDESFPASDPPANNRFD
jgi:hypothetical protein